MVSQNPLADVLVLVVLVVVLHEATHLAVAYKRVRGIFIGFYRKTMALGFIVHPIRVLDLVLPQVTVPIAMVLLYGATPMALMGSVFNLAGGVIDLANVGKVKYFNSLDREGLMDWIRRNLSGKIIWVKPL